MPYRVGIDIGGTFTDFIVLDGHTVAATWKQDSTPEDPIKAFSRGLAEIASQLRMSVREFLEHTSLIIHGTTSGMNTVLQRTGPRVGLVCTEGFRDVLYFRDGFKPDRFNLQLRHPRALVDRALCLGITERIDARGEVVTKLDEASVRRAAATLSASGVEAVAVALLWSPVNNAHERRAAEILREELPDLPVLEAADVLPEIREWERTSATVLSAYLLPEIRRYLQRLEHYLDKSGFAGSLLVMQTNGGCASVAEILQRPVYSLASGPAAAPAAALYSASADMRNLLVMDLGGTSFDVSLVTDGRPRISRTMQIEGQPLGVAGVAVHSIGAGGGSVAWVDSGGVVQVGPLSAGARPGPACYGQGGTRPTVTDAYVVLGYLATDAFLGGRRELYDTLAADAIEREIARTLGVDTVAAADGIKRVVEAKMVRAIHAMSIRRGIDPRHYTLIVGGGAGGLHAANIARQIGINRVVAPAHASVLCALGMTVTDVQHDYAKLLRTSADDPDLSALNALFTDMERNALDRLDDEGFGSADIYVERSVDARYRGQIYELTVPLAESPPLTSEHLTAACAAFHEQHKLLYGYERRDLPIELLHWRVAARARIAQAPSSAPSVTSAVPGPSASTSTQRLMYFSELGGWILTDIFNAAELQAGSEVDGPAVIQAPDTTVLLSAGDRAKVRPDRSYEITVSTVPRTGSSAPAPDLLSR